MTKKSQPYRAESPQEAQTFHDLSDAVKERGEQVTGMTWNDLAKAYDTSDIMNEYRNVRAGATANGGELDTEEFRVTAKDAVLRRTEETLGTQKLIDIMGISQEDFASKYDTAELQEMYDKGASIDEILAYAEELLNDQRGYTIAKQGLANFNRKQKIKTGETDVAEVPKIKTERVPSAPASPEETKSHETISGDHDPHYNTVKTLADAAELVYRDPPYLNALLEESRAYASFRVAHSDGKEPHIAESLQRYQQKMEDSVLTFHKVVGEWQAQSSETNFHEYVTAVLESDIPDGEKERAQVMAEKARMQIVDKVMRNPHWREMEMISRMAEQVVGDGEVRDDGKAFAATYFRAPGSTTKTPESPKTLPSAPEAPKAPESSSPAGEYVVMTTPSGEVRGEAGTKAPEATKPEPAVASAREAVAEALGEMGEVNEIDKQALLGEVLRAAKNKTRISTVAPNGMKVKYGSGERSLRGGHSIFGDDEAFPSDMMSQARVEIEGATHEGPPETFTFKDLTEEVRETQMVEVDVKVVTGKGRKQKTEIVRKKQPELVVVGEKPVMATNPETGQQEAGVRVTYQFKSSNRHERVEWDDDSGRSGNYLQVETVLPKSMAERLRAGAADDPQLAREFAKMLTLENGVPESEWDRRVGPPYNRLPDDWRMAIDGHGSASASTNTTGSGGYGRAA